MGTYALCGRSGECRGGCEWSAGVHVPTFYHSNQQDDYPNTQALRKAVQRALSLDDPSDIQFLVCQHPAHSIIWRDERPTLELLSEDPSSFSRWATLVYFAPTDSTHSLYVASPDAASPLPAGFALLRPADICSTLHYNSLAEAFLPPPPELLREKFRIVTSPKFSQLYGVGHSCHSLVPFCQTHQPAEGCSQAAITEGLLTLAGHRCSDGIACSGPMGISFAARASSGKPFALSGLALTEIPRAIESQPGATCFIEKYRVSEDEVAVLSELLAAYLSAGLTFIAGSPSKTSSEGRLAILDHAVHVVGQRVKDDRIDFVYNCPNKGPFLTRPARELLTVGFTKDDRGQWINEVWVLAPEGLEQRKAGTLAEEHQARAGLRIVRKPGWVKQA